MGYMGTSTPWGVAQGSKVFQRGVTFYRTARHGGFRLGVRANAKIPEPMRNEDGWYEEDCEAAKVMFIFRDLFAEDYDDAVVTLKDYFPDEYEAVTGEIVPEKESYVRSKCAFAEVMADQYVVVAAWGDYAPDCPKGYVIGLARLGGATFGRGKYFLIPEEEYKKRGRFGFVIESVERYKELIDPKL
jgi:hypothetical protein